MMLRALLVLAAATGQPDPAHLERVLRISAVLDRCITSAIARIDNGFMDAEEVSQRAQLQCEAPYVAFMIEEGLSRQHAIEIARTPGDGRPFLEDVLAYRRMRRGK